MPEAANRNNCRAEIMSEAYADFIVERSKSYRDLETEAARACEQMINFEYYSVSLPREQIDPLRIEDNGYAAIPNCYTLLDSSSMQAAGILSVQTQPILELKGDGVMIGFVDTGIDYTSDLFRNADGTTRVEAIWDQTDQSGEPPSQYAFGTLYSREQINAALQSEQPETVVGSQDTYGHGTYIASLAAGSADREEDFIGAAPEATLAVVKLKEAKQYLKDFLFIESEKPVYQENDIMMGVAFLHQLAAERGMPLVICVALGTNQGDHSGAGPLSAYLDSIANMTRRVVVAGAGNEANARHHYEGHIAAAEETDPVEIRVGDECSGFLMELWAQAPDIYSIAIVSPTGERISRIPPREGSQEFDFVFENTRVYVDYRTVEGGEGVELILVRFAAPTAGIWTVEVTGNQVVNGRFNIWLPNKEFLSSEVYFLRPSPEITLTEPACGVNLISVAAYNHRTGSISVDSGRGFNRLHRIKPNFAAPGVEVSGGFPGGRFAASSGSSAAAAITSGAAALLLEWGVIRNDNPRMNSAEVKGILVRGAVGIPGTMYPSREWGYGKLDLYNSFEHIRNP